MHITRKNLIRLVRNTEYDPKEIGIAVLRSLGYEVTEHFNGAIAVTDKYTNKLLFWYNGAYVD